ncbi:MAG: FixH family protein [Pseudomonadales bacterium]|nr:FixH family protein [Pseudomonadales bacterium]
MATDPWYKQGWPWILMAIPFSAVLFGMFMLFMAGRHPDDLVSDDYYRDGLAINQQLARNERAVDEGIGIRLMDIVGDQVRFSVSNATDSAILLSLHHVVYREKDRQVVLYPDVQPGVYSTDDPALATLIQSPGIWYMEFEGADEPWRIQHRVESPVANLEINDQ